MQVYNVCQLHSVKRQAKLDQQAFQGTSCKAYQQDVWQSSSLQQAKGRLSATLQQLQQQALLCACLLS